MPQHIHASYPWRCNSEGHESTTDERHVTCPECLSNKLISDYGRYVAQFPAITLDTDPQSQLEHVISEVIEIAAAIESGDIGHAIEETMDLLHSAETLLNRLTKDQAVKTRQKMAVIRKNTERGYYN